MSGRPLTASRGEGPAFLVLTAGAGHCEPGRRHASTLGVVSLSWDERKRLLRIAGLGEELLGVAQASRVGTPAGLNEQVAFLMNEVHGVLSSSDQEAADEFERIVLRGPRMDLAAELRVGALVGWLKAELAAESIEESRQGQAESPSARRRKQTVGFKIRSPITREHSIVEGPVSDQSHGGSPP